jgi:hypothetical protein
MTLPNLIAFVISNYSLKFTNFTAAHGTTKESAASSEMENSQPACMEQIIAKPAPTENARYVSSTILASTC